MKFINNINLPLESFNEEYIYHPNGLSDGNLYTEDGCVFAINRCLLATKSRYFYIIFCEVDINRTDILIPGIKGVILKKILTYLYTNNIHFTQDDIADILLTSDYLLMDDLVQLCEAYARYNISSTNCLKMFTKAFHLNQEEIFRHSFRILRLYFDKVINNANSEIDDLPLDGLKRIISSKNLCGRSENSIWNLIVTWIVSDKSHRLVYVPELIMYIDIMHLNEALASLIVDHDIVRNNPCLKDLTEMKASGRYSCNLEILQVFYRARYLSSLDVCPDVCNLLPSKLYIFVKIDFARESEITLFITYDENINIWRKICHCHFYPHYITSFQDSIYAMMFSSDPFIFKRFSLIEKVWISIRKPKAVSFAQTSVEHQGLIYFLGCRTGPEINSFSRVVAYNPNLSTWNEMLRMTPVFKPSAESLDGKIYVIGWNPSRREYSEIIFQVYDPVRNAWTSLPSLFFHSRLDHYMWTTAIRSRFYVIVEIEPVFLRGEPIFDTEQLKASVYDPVKRLWTALPDPPAMYAMFGSTNLYDELITYDFSSGYDRSILRWNDYMNQWETFEETSVLENISEFNIFSIVSGESVDIFTKVNKTLFTEFEESPFKQEPSNL